MSRGYNILKIKSTRWPVGHLKVNLVISTELAAKIIELIGLYEGTAQVLTKLPSLPREADGKFRSLKEEK